MTRKVVTVQMSTSTLTKRAWLASQTGPNGQPLAKDGPGVRGRFSHAAQAALTEAISAGMVFSDSDSVKATAPKATNTTIVKAPKPAAIPSDAYEAKEVRAWAATVGITLGNRGRIPAEVISQYLAQNGEKVVKAATVPPAEVKVREQNEAWVFARRRPNDPDYLTEPLVGIHKCGKCSKRISICSCEDGPFAPLYLTNGVYEKASLTKPVV